MAFKLRIGSGSSRKGKEIGGAAIKTIKSLYDVLMKSFTKLKDTLMSTRGTARKEEVKVDYVDHTKVTNIGYEPVVVGEATIYISTNSDDSIFEDAPIFCKIPIEEDDSEEEPTRILVSSKPVSIHGLPVEPLQDSSDIISSRAADMIYAPASVVPTSTDVVPVKQEVSMTSGCDVIRSDDHADSVAGDTGPVMPEFRRENKDAKVSIRSKPTVLVDETDMVCLTIPELVVDCDDVFLGQDAPDYDEDMSVYFPKPVLLVEGVHDSGIVVSFPSVDPVIDVTEGMVYLESHAVAEVFDEGYVDERRPKAPVDVSEAVVRIKEDDAPTVSFFFGMSDDTKESVVRFIF